MRDKPVRYGRLLPELRRFESSAERRAVLRHLMRESWRDWRTWVFVIGYFVALAGVVVAVVPVTRWLPIDTAVAGGLIGGIGGGLLVYGFNLMFRRPLRRKLREQLVERGVPICIPCAYDLRGQSETRCPECGAAFDEGLLDGADGGED